LLYILYNFVIYIIYIPVGNTGANQHRSHSNIHCVFILSLFVISPPRLLRIVSTDFLALRLFCFNIRQHGCQILYFKLHVDGRKFHYQRPQAVHRCAKHFGGAWTPGSPGYVYATWLSYKRHGTSVCVWMSSFIVSSLVVLLAIFGFLILKVRI